MGGLQVKSVLVYAHIIRNFGIEEREVSNVNVISSRDMSLHPFCQAVQKSANSAWPFWWLFKRLLSDVRST